MHTAFFSWVSGFLAATSASARAAAGLRGRICPFRLVLSASADVRPLGVFFGEGFC